jgi:hypothetical protein
MRQFEQVIFFGWIFFDLDFNRIFSSFSSRRFGAWIFFPAVKVQVK